MYVSMYVGVHTDADEYCRLLYNSAAAAAAAEATTTHKKTRDVDFFAWSTNQGLVGVVGGGQRTFLDDPSKLCSQFRHRVLCNPNAPGEKNKTDTKVKRNDAKKDMGSNGDEHSQGVTSNGSPTTIRTKQQTENHTRNPGRHTHRHANITYNRMHCSMVPMDENSSASI